MLRAIFKRRSRSVAPSQAEQPLLDDFLPEDQDPYQYVEREAVPAPGKIAIGSSVLVGALVAGLILAAAAIYEWNSPRKTLADAPFAFFELTALSPEGHPVAGAIVKNGQQSVGVTDSFGEWRRYMRVRPGSTLSIDITKPIGDDLLRARKNVAVPLQWPERGELKLRQRISLRRISTPAMASNKQPNLAEQPDSGATLAASAGPAIASSSVSSASADPRLADFESIWISVTKSQDKKGDRALKAALQRRARALGLRVDPQAGLRLELNRLRKTDGQQAETASDLLAVRLSLTKSSAGGHRELTQFLRNERQSANQSAKAVFDVLANITPAPVQLVSEGGQLRLPDAKLWSKIADRLVQDNEGMLYRIEQRQQEWQIVGSSQPQCNRQDCELHLAGVDLTPPVRGWQRLELRLTGAPKAATVYVSGYEARPGPDQTWSYWGESDGAANLTVVNQGRIIHRTRLRAQPAKAPVVAIPAATVSRR